MIVFILASKREMEMHCFSRYVYKVVYNQIAVDISLDHGGKRSSKVKFLC